MPQYLTFDAYTDIGDESITLSCSTEEELLEFANKIRKAGGADILDKLLPSTPEASKACLIANALNFGCEVTPTTSRSATTKQRKWEMIISADCTSEQLSGISEILGEPAIETIDYYHFNLPQELGNAADAFDHGHYAEFSLSEISKKEIIEASKV